MENNATLEQIVRYIYLQYDSQERFEIDRNLLRQQYDPVEIETAWKIILSGKQKKILEGKRTLSFNQIIRKTIFGLIISGGVGMVTGLAYIGWICIAAILELDRNQTLPFVLMFTIFFGVTLIFALALFPRRKLIGKISLGLTLVQLILFIGVLIWVSIPSDAASLPPFQGYPNATLISETYQAYNIGEDKPRVSIKCENDTIPPYEVYATEAFPQTLVNFYADQFWDMGNEGLRISFGDGYVEGVNTTFNDNTKGDTAVCFTKKSHRLNIATNAVIIVNAQAHRAELTKLVPVVPPGTLFLVFVFNGFVRVM